jgi:hypothetical protein
MALREQAGEFSVMIELSLVNVSGGETPKAMLRGMPVVSVDAQVDARATIRFEVRVLVLSEERLGSREAIEVQDVTLEERV